MNRAHCLLAAFIIGTAFYFYPQPQVNADAALVSLFLPVAIEAGKVAMPYVVKAISNMGRTMAFAGIELLNIFRLPIGLVQTVFLSPFGNNFSSGLKNLGKGIAAPFLFAGYVLFLPISALGYQL